jgi:hypothetical protein
VALFRLVHWNPCFLFLYITVYITDIFKLSDSLSSSKLYDDNFNMYSAFHTREDDEFMQRRLQDIEVWSDAWQLKIAYKKGSSLLIGRCVYEFEFTLGLGKAGILLNCLKILGVDIDKKCQLNTLSK